jgi:hypothetical protein
MDLVAIKNGERLLIEVKGRGRIWSFITMTNNEFDAFKSGKLVLCEVYPHENGEPIVDLRSTSEVEKVVPAQVKVYFKRKKRTA